jgi:hypothetical protein
LDEISTASSLQDANERRISKNKKKRLKDMGLN